MKTPGFWTKFSLVSTLLLPLSGLYFLGAQVRPLLTKPVKVNVPVLCVGNLTAGGAGKTPTVVALVEFLRELGAVPHVLSRGYGGSLSGPLQVDPDKHSAGEVGDEPLLLARHAPVWIGKDRVASAKAAIVAGATVLIMDDGFQNPSLNKDLSLLVVGGSYGFGNQRLLPAGPLREGLSSGLARSQGMLIIGEDVHNVGEYAEGKALLKARIQADNAASQRLNGQDVVAFAGIGLPEKFRKTLEALGANVVSFQAFADHHKFTISEIEALIGKAKDLDVPLVTTEKDWVRLPEKLRASVQQLPIEVVFEDEAQVRSWLAGNLIG